MRNKVRHDDAINAVHKFRKAECGVIYAHDVSRHIIMNTDEIIEKWADTLFNDDQRVWWMVMRIMVLPQLRLHTKESRQKFDKDAFNTVRRVERNKQKNVSRPGDS